MLPRRIAIVPLGDPGVSSGGIIIPDEAKERSDQGFIKYLGEDCDEFEIGDYVMFSGYSGTNISLEGEGDFIIIQKDFIICKIHDFNTSVPGLYYRDKKGWKEIETELIKALLEFNPDKNLDICFKKIMNLISEHNPYFNADYENSLNLIRSSAKSSPFHRSTRIGWKHGSKLENSEQGF